ncbi:MAG: P-loop NTPase fold protein, partial [Cyanobacteria bacterium]|nr:P-loop NTPase fold protein [Cyanobacteriota bacterium]
MPRLPAHDIDLITTALLASSRLDQEQHRTRILVAIASQVSDHHVLVLEALLAAAETLTDPQAQAEVWAQIARKLPENQREPVWNAALKVVATLLSELEHVQALLSLCADLSGEERQSLLTQALNKIATMRGAAVIEALRVMAPYIGPANLTVQTQVMAVIEGLKWEQNQVEALETLAPYLLQSQPAWVERGLHMADTMPSAPFRSRALQFLAPYLPSEPLLLEKALAMAAALGNERYRLPALLALIPYLEKAQQVSTLEAALDALGQIDDEADRAKTLGQIGSLLTHAALDRWDLVIEAIATLRQAQPRARVLGEIAAQVPAKYRERLIPLAEQIDRPVERIQALEVIAPLLAEEQRNALLATALTTANELTNPQAHITALTAIARHLTTNQRWTVLTTALRSVERITNPQRQAEVLATLIPHLPPDRQIPAIIGALNAAANIPSSRYRTDAIAPILPLVVSRIEEITLGLSSEQHPLLLELLEYLPTATDRITVLGALSPRISQTLGPEFLHQIAIVLPRNRDRASAFCTLVPYIQPEQRDGALQWVYQAFKVPHHQVTALVALVPQLPLHLLETVLARLPAIPSPHLQGAVLVATAAALAGCPQAFLSPPEQPSAPVGLITRLLDLLSQFQSLSTGSLSYEHLAAEVLSRLTATMPALSDPHQGHIQQRFTALTSALVDMGYRAQILSSWARALPPSADVAHLIAHTLAPLPNSPYSRGLRVQVQAISSHPLDEGWFREEIAAISDPYAQAEAWVAWASHPQGQRHQSLALRQLGHLPEHQQTELLCRLIPHLTHPHRLEAATLTRDLDHPHQRARAIVTLAQRFPEFRSEAQQHAKQFSKPAQSILYLSALAIEVPDLLPDILQIADEVASGQITDDTTAPLPSGEQCAHILAALAPHLPLRINDVVHQLRLDHRPLSRELWQRAFFCLARSYRDALLGGSLQNDAAQDEDLLNLKDEINALADLLLMRDLQPPMTVGILGGWGGGKSYIMHLMQARMTALRSRAINPQTEAWHPNPHNERLSPYVGHVYQIRFDAWTFAKSDLWASLMQTIFLELDRQISLEQRMAEVLAGEDGDPAEVLCRSGPYWSVLYKSNDEERRYFLERVLEPTHLEALDHQNMDSVLWEQFLKQEYGQRKLAEEQHLAEQKALRAEKAAKHQAMGKQLGAIQADIAAKHRQQRERTAYLHMQASQEVTQAIDGALRISRIILVQRLGQPVYDALKQAIAQALDQSIHRSEESTPESSSSLLSADTTTIRALITHILETGIFTVNGRQINLNRQVLKQWLLKNSWMVVGCGVLGLMALGLPILLAAVQVESWAAQLAGLMVPLLPAVGIGQRLLRSGQRWHRQVMQTLADYGEQTADFHQRREQEAAIAVARRIETDLELRSLTQDLDNLTQQQQRLTQTMEDLAQETAVLDQHIAREEAALPQLGYGSLSSFVKARLEDNSYDQHLGLMHQVKQDLQTLSYSLLPPIDATDLGHQLTTLRQVFPRGPARVVIYIDDLDRCPPDRVVAVLEAVQLLVKTP